MDKRYVFDGFAHREFIPAIDGWMDTQTPASSFACVAQARSVLSLFGALNHAEFRIWELERENANLRKALGWPDREVDHE
jgi:hypothetical protein